MNSEQTMKRRVITLKMVIINCCQNNGLDGLHRKNTFTSYCFRLERGGLKYFKDGRRGLRFLLKRQPMFDFHAEAWTSLWVLILHFWYGFTEIKKTANFRKAFQIFGVEHHDV